MVLSASNIREAAERLNQAAGGIEAAARAAMQSSRSAAWLGPGAEQYLGATRELQTHLTTESQVLRQAQGLLNVLAIRLDSTETLVARGRRSESDATTSVVQAQRNLQAARALPPGDVRNAAVARAQRDLDRANGALVGARQTIANANDQAEADIRSTDRQIALLTTPPRGAVNVRGALETAKDYLELRPFMHFLGMGLAGGATMLVGRLYGTSSRVFRSGLGRYAAANRWIRTAAKKFPYLALALDAGETVVYGGRYGFGSDQAIKPLVDGAGLATSGLIVKGAVDSAAVVGADTIAAPAALGAAAFGTGALIGSGINWSTEKLTGESLSDRWADAAVNDDLKTINDKTAAGQPLSASDKAKLHDLTTFGGTVRAMIKGIPRIRL